MICWTWCDPFQWWRSGAGLGQQQRQRREADGEHQVAGRFRHGSHHPDRVDADVVRRGGVADVAEGEAAVAREVQVGGELLPWSGYAFGPPIVATKVEKLLGLVPPLALKRNSSMSLNPGRASA